MHPEQPRSGPALATAAGTAAFAARFPALAATGHFRKLRGLGGDAAGVLVSSLGIGTYLGAPDQATDAGYAASLRLALDGGVNLIDTASNYRNQRSERVVGSVLASAAREELLVCSKAGFTDHGGHDISPVFLAQTLQRSLDNLGLAAVDVYYLHNPEVQQASLSREEFYRRLRLAFELLEKQVLLGRIRAYGAATWSGFRVPPDSPEFLDLQRMVDLAHSISGDQHHFRFIQLPFNLAMTEAYTLLNQTVQKPPYVSTLNAAYRLGLNVVASATLMNGRLAALPDDARAHLAAFLPPAASDAELAAQFVRSTAGVTAGLVGMSSPDHVAANLRAIAVPPSPPAQIGRLLQQ